MNKQPTRANTEERQRQTSILDAVWPRLVEVWILVMLVIFLVLRVLESHTMQRILTTLRLRRIG